MMSFLVFKLTVQSPAVHPQELSTSVYLLGKSLASSRLHNQHHLVVFGYRRAGVGCVAVWFRSSVYEIGYLKVCSKPFIYEGMKEVKVAGKKSSKHEKRFVLI